MGISENIHYICTYPRTKAMKEDKRLKRKVRNSYLVSTLSIALVLFLLGSVGYLMLAAHQLATTLQGSMMVMVELSRESTATEREALLEALQQEPLASKIVDVSKEEKAADEEFRKLFAASFEEVLGENPLLDSYEVTLSAASEDQAAVEAFMDRISPLEGVDRVSYPAQLAEQLHSTIGKIRFVLLLFCGALLLISLILVNNTVRLAIYSKRYVINTMKLVGATKWFIMRPFLASSLLQGIWAGLIAAALFGLALYGVGEAVPEFTSLAEWRPVWILGGGMLAVGMSVSLLFTTFAINKFVNMKSNKIHLY